MVLVVFSALLLYQFCLTFKLGLILGRCSEILDLLKFTSDGVLRSSLIGKIIISYLDYHATGSVFIILSHAFGLSEIITLAIYLIMFTEEEKEERERITVVAVVELAYFMVMLAFTAVMIYFASVSTNAEMVTARLMTLSAGLKVFCGLGITGTLAVLTVMGVHHYWK